MVDKPLIVVDKDVPFVVGVFEPFARVSYLLGEAIDASAVKEATALVIRTRTRCDALLLEGSRVKLIVTATIGTDHIQEDYCRRKGISVVNAPGCNALAVMQYVFTALVFWSKKRSVPLQNKTLGIVGVGNVGSRVAALGRQLGFRVLLNDPPRAQKEGGNDFLPLEDVVRQSDILTFHVPLTPSTKRMVSHDLIGCARPGMCLVNSSRGSVVDATALMDNAKKLGGLVLDVWPDEPHVDATLVGLTDVATPHIAGYSLEGKRNASQVAVRAVAQFFGWESLCNCSIPLPRVEHVPDELLFTHCFPIFALDKMLRESPRQFESLRHQYVFRREWTNEQYKRLQPCLLPQI